MEQAIDDGKASERPLVSVVIPSYNGAQFIGECLDSILDQTYQALEIVVVDDGSTDATASIVNEKYGARVRLVRQRNAGVAHARHTGIVCSSGEFIAFCDQDDLWEREKIAHQMAVLQKYSDVVVVHSNAIQLRLSDNVTSIYAERHPSIKCTDRRALLVGIIRQYDVPLLSTYVIRRSFMSDHGIRFADFPAGVDDLGVFIEILLARGTPHYLDAPLVVKREHSANQSSQYVLRYRRRIPLYESLLAKWCAECSVCETCELRWGLADASGRVADELKNERNVDREQLVRLYRNAWRYNPLNIKAVAKWMAARLGLLGAGVFIGEQ